MKRVLIATMLVAGMMVAGPVAAQSDSTTDTERRHRTHERGQRVERLRLACRPVREPEGVACRWSQARHPQFAAYRLWRGDREGRSVVHSTDERDRTHHFDTDADPRAQAFYVVEVLDADGRRIGRSNAAPVHGHHRHRQRHTAPRAVGPAGLIR